MKLINTKNYVVTVIYILIIVALIVFGIFPYINTLSANQSKYNETRDSLNATLKKYTQLSELAKNEQEIVSTKKDVYELIPDNEETADFVVKLEALAKELTIPEYINSISTSQIMSTSSSSKTPKKDAKKEVSYSIGFTSNYTTIQSFLEKLYNFPRFTTIKNINISGYNSEEDTLSFKLNGVIYYGK